jgi:hypothetical protein
MRARGPRSPSACVAVLLTGAVAASAALGLVPRTARAMTLAPVDGGPHYYRQFSHPLPDKRAFFPIMAWLRKVEEQSDINAYADFGLNGLVGVENPEGAQETLLRKAGLHVIIQADERTRFDNLGSETAGWLLYDEVDMCCGPPGFAGGNGYQILDAVRAGLPRDNRLRYNNYGKGVIFWESDSEAGRFINAYQDVVSSDLYWFTDPNERSRPGYRVAASYGATVDRMRHLDTRDGKRQPVWNLVELGWPFTESASQGGRRILPAESRAAVWQSIIAGARGIVYFDHNFGPGTPASTLLGEGYADTRATMKAVNGQITALAPVLNSPTVTSGWSQGPGTTAMVKWANGGKATKQGCTSKSGKKRRNCRNRKAAESKHRRKKGAPKGDLYMFAGSAGSSVKGRFSLPCVGNTNARVVGENRRVRVHKGSLRDRFADGNAIHIYRIDPGSKCRVTRRAAVSHADRPPGGNPGSSSGDGSNPVPGVVIAAIGVVLAGLLVFLGIRHRPKPPPPPPQSGRRAKPGHRLRTR